MIFKGLFLVILCVEIVHGAPNDGKEIADKFGEDLSFASKQVIRGFTAIFAPILDTAQIIPQLISKAIPVNAIPGHPLSTANQNFQQVIVRDGLNALGKGVKAGATILSSPARVVGTGLDEARKIGQATAGVEATPIGSVPMDDRTKVVSTLLNTTSNQLSQANLGAVLLEVAMKNRVKDVANKTGAALPKLNPAPLTSSIEKRQSSFSAVKEDALPTTTSRVDELLAKFNEAVKRNDERLLEALKVIIARIDPPKN